MKNQMLRLFKSGTYCALILSLIIFIGPNLPHANASLKTPLMQVDKFHNVLLSIMKDANQLGVFGRFRTLEPVLIEIFHFKAMVQIASGSFWEIMSNGDQIKLLDTFTRLSIATYAAQFDGYSGQVFKIIGTKPGPQKTTLVETRIVNTDSSSIALTYVFRKIKGEWRILDVLLDTGISELARKRSEFREALRTGGAEALLIMMESKADTLLIN